jgi:hypothetical protein
MEMKRNDISLLLLEFGNMTLILSARNSFVENEFYHTRTYNLGFVLTMTSLWGIKMGVILIHVAYDMETKTKFVSSRVWVKLRCGI